MNDDLLKPKRKAVWVREFMCHTCGKRHRVEGPRGTLGAEQRKREEECKVSK